MGIFDKVKETAGQAKDKVTKIASETASSIMASNEEAKELKKPLEGSTVRYEFTYIGGLDDIPKAKSGAWGMNVMNDMFSFRVTNTTKDWLYDMDTPMMKLRISELKKERSRIRKCFSAAEAMQINSRKT